MIENSVAVIEDNDADKSAEFLPRFYEPGSKSEPPALSAEASGLVAALGRRARRRRIGRMVTGD